MISVVTIARQYGSGGAELGRLVASNLGWELLDRQLVDRVAHVAGVDPKIAAKLDEHAHRWWQWVVAGMSFAAPCGTPAGSGAIDEDSLHDITMQLLQRAADSGKCVIVGRGAQCFLQGWTDVLNVLAYAPIEQRVWRLRARQPDCIDARARIKEVDSERAGYIRQHFGKDWLDKSLYDVCISTALGLEVSADLVVAIVASAKRHAMNQASAQSRPGFARRRKKESSHIMSVARLSKCLVTAGLAFVSLLSSGCNSTAARPSATPAEVATVTIRPEPVVLSTELPGRTCSYLIAEIRPQVNGLIQERLFREGANVRAGEVLYQIDPAPYKAAYEQAKASLATAEADLVTAKANLPAIQLREERLKGLAAIHAVGQQDYDDASAALRQAEATIEARKAAVDVSRAAVESARINLYYTPIKAPISGRIGISNITVGAMATAYQPTALAVVQQLDPIYVDVTQASSELLRLRQRLESGRLKQDGPIQSRVKLLLEDGTTYPLEGTLQFRDVTVEPTTGSVTLRLIFANPKQVLLPGMFVRAVVQEGVSEHALLVPQQGVTRNTNGTPIAWIVNKDNKVEQRTLELDRAIGDKWLVVKGLEAGDRLIVEGLQRVRPGDQVRTVASVAEASGHPDASTEENAKGAR